MGNQGLFAVNEQLLQVIDDNANLTKQQEAALLNETKKLSIGYLRDVCQQAAHRSMQYMVHTVQYVLCWMLEKIHEKQTNNHSLFREKMAGQLAAFLNFVQKHSAQWFNIDAAMPHYIWLPIHATLKDGFYPGKKFLLQQSAPELVGLVQQVYQLTTTAPTPSYRQAAYWQQLSTALQNNTADPDNNHTKTVYTLLHYNFNHPGFIQYVFNCYLKGAAEADNAKNHWQQAFQHINRIVPETGLVLLHDADDCRKNLLLMIQNEINTVQFVQASGTVFKNNLPYMYNLSVAQLGVLFRLQVDAGMLQTDNITEMLRYLAAHTVTTRTDAIGTKSLYNSYHQPDRAALQIMMEYNTRMRTVLTRLLD